MIIAGKERRPVYEYWVPEYSDFVLPIKKDGSPFVDPEDYEEYLDWLVDYLESNNLELNDHHKDIVLVEQFEDLSAGHLCLILGSGASVAVFQHDMGDGLSYPDDYLSNPNPERIAEQDVVESWIEGFKNFQDCMLEFYNNREEMETEMISVEDFFVFNYMYQIEHEIYDIYKKRIHPHSATFSDIGWRALLKKAISRTDNFEEKREALKSFHSEYDEASWK
jgi:hypothetical protein